jgi:hypothetical protein
VVSNVFRAIVLVLCLASFPCAGQEDREPGPIAPETARHRIRSVLAAAEPDAEELAVLVEVAERSEDASIGALASFNAGTLAMQLGDARARELLRSAELNAADLPLRARARFNLAHALMPSEEGPPADIDAIDARIGALREAAGVFRSVLDLDPDHADAAANTERVRRMIRDLLRERERMEAEQRALEELADELEQLAEQQDQQAAESRERADRGEASPESQGGEQRALNKKTEQASSRAEDAGAGDAAREAMEEAMAAQERAEEALGRGDSGQAAEEQREAAEALRRAAEQVRGEQAAGRGQGERSEGDGEETSQAQPESQSENPPGDPGESGPQIDPLAEALLNKERREREQRGQYLQRGRRQQVERDW